MPSLHVGWAVLIAVAVIHVSTSRRRWWILLHPALTALAVVVTANHFWLDGIVAAGLLGLSMLAVGAVDRARARYRRPGPVGTGIEAAAPAPEGIPVPEGVAPGR
jgi:hypothetical protein